MLLPKGRPIHEDMATTYVKMDHLIKELKGEGFSGYLRLDTPDLTIVLFFEQGKISGAFSSPPVRDPLLSLMEEASKEGTLDVYALPPEMVYIMASAAQGEELYRDLPLEIIDLDRLMKRLERDSFTGLLKMEDEGDVATVLLFEGEPIEYLYESENLLQGQGALEAIRAMSQSPLAVLSLLKSADTVEELKFDPQEAIDSLEGFFMAYRDKIESIMGRGRFDRLFREASLALVDEYPFLDPFAPSLKVTAEGLDVDDSLSLTPMLKGVRALVREMNRLVSEKKGEEDVRKMMDSLSALLGEQPFLKTVFQEGEGH